MLRALVAYSAFIALREFHSFMGGWVSWGSGQATLKYAEVADTDYSEFKLLEKSSRCKKETLTLLSVPLKVGNKFPMWKLAFLHQEAESQAYSQRWGNQGLKAGNKPC